VLIKAHGRVAKCAWCGGVIDNLTARPFGNFCCPQHLLKWKERFDRGNMVRIPGGYLSTGRDTIRFKRTK